MATWLHSLMKDYGIPSQVYDDIYNLLVSESKDIAEKCELLEELLQPNDNVEQFVRLVLETLEQKTVDSLLNPDSHSQGISKKKRTKSFAKDLSDTTKSIDSLSVQDDNDIPEGVEQYNSLTPLEMLQNIFTNIDIQRLEAALESSNYNIEDAMDLLFNDTGEPKKAKQVCRHFMVGNCYRSDCWFSHDPDALICKFWLKGRCYKGDNCEFSHGQTVEQYVPPTPSPPKPQQEPPKLDDFPVLGNASNTKKFDFLAPTSSYNDILKKPVEKTKYQEYYERDNSQRSSVAKIDAQWVSTGDTLASSYFKYRSDAIDVALNRNKLFQRATEAYLSGNKAAARALSLTAQQLNAQVMNLHNQAASKIFSERNRALGTSSGEAMIDLHGLHPLEAVDKLNETLNQLRTSRYKGRVVIITGTGHHSRGKSKVLPIIKEHLQTNGWKPRDATLDDGRGGMLIINI